MMSVYLWTRCGMAQDYRSMEDETLAARVREKDPEAFAELSARYAGMIRGEALRRGAPGAPDPDDLMQEGFLALYAAASRYSPKRGAAFRTYAAACIRNRMTDAVRAHAAGGNRALSESLPLTEPAAAQSGPEELLELRERLMDLRRQVDDRLSPLEKTALSLYLSGCDRREIPKRFGMPLRTFDNAVYRVRKKLRGL